MVHFYCIQLSQTNAQKTEETQLIIIYIILYLYNTPTVGKPSSKNSCLVKPDNVAEFTILEAYLRKNI